MDHTVVQITWAEATVLAQWVGGRFPTDAEWEHATRGGSAPKRFP